MPFVLLLSKRSTPTVWLSPHFVASTLLIHCVSPGCRVMVTGCVGADCTPTLRKRTSVITTWPLGLDSTTSLCHRLPPMPGVLKMPNRYALASDGVTDSTKDGSSEAFALVRLAVTLALAGLAPSKVQVQAFGLPVDWSVNVTGTPG